MFVAVVIIDTCLSMVAFTIDTRIFNASGNLSAHSHLYVGFISKFTEKVDSLGGGGGRSFMNVRVWLCYVSTHRVTVERSINLDFLHDDRDLQHCTLLWAVYQVQNDAEAQKAILRHKSERNFVNTSFSEN